MRILAGQPPEAQEEKNTFKKKLGKFVGCHKNIVKSQCTKLSPAGFKRHEIFPGSPSCVLNFVPLGKLAEWKK